MFDDNEYDAADENPYDKFNEFCTIEPAPAKDGLCRFVVQKPFNVKIPWNESETLISTFAFAPNTLEIEQASTLYMYVVSMMYRQSGKKSHSMRDVSNKILALYKGMEIDNLIAEGFQEASIDSKGDPIYRLTEKGLKALDQKEKEVQSRLSPDIKRIFDNIRKNGMQ